MRALPPAALGFCVTEPQKSNVVTITKYFWSSFSLKIESVKTEKTLCM